MKFVPDRHHRRSLRLQGYDYMQAGAYFVTTCTQSRECLFGEIMDEEMRLNKAGQMVQSVWNELPQHYTGIVIDAFIVMPNHVHGIIVLGVGAGPSACPTPGQPQEITSTLSLAAVVHRFKSLTTARYRHGVSQNNWRSFPGRLWQRNYYEHIIRNEEELRSLRQYILDNPEQWALDQENPALLERPRHRAT